MIAVPTLATTLWALNVALDTTGQLCFKAAARRGGPGSEGWLRMARQPWIWLGVAAFGAEFLTWLAFLTLVPLSRGVLLGSINIVVIMLAGRWVFREALTPLRVAGILLISAGVAVVGAN